LATSGLFGSVWRAAINENAVRADLAVRHGGGAWCIAQGLDLGDGGGLLGTVGTGMALIDGGVPVSAVMSVPLLAGVNHLWLARTADASVRTDLLLPAGAAAYLGRIVTDGAAVTELDRSGVLVMRGGTLYRRTADEGMPEDSPPAGLQFVAQTLGGRYLWTGSEYARIWEPLALHKDTLAEGECMAVPAGYQVLLMDGISVAVGAAVLVEGKLGVMR